MNATIAAPTSTVLQYRPYYLKVIIYQYQWIFLFQLLRFPNLSQISLRLMVLVKLHQNSLKIGIFANLFWRLRYPHPLGGKIANNFLSILFPRNPWPEDDPWRQPVGGAGWGAWPDDGPCRQPVGGAGWGSPPWTCWGSPPTATAATQRRAGCSGHTVQDMNSKWRHFIQEFYSLESRKNA